MNRVIGLWTSSILIGCLMMTCGCATILTNLYNQVQTPRNGQLGTASLNLFSLRAAAEAPLSTGIASLVDVLLGFGTYYLATETGNEDSASGTSYYIVDNTGVVVIGPGTGSQSSSVENAAEARKILRAIRIERMHK